MNENIATVISINVSQGGVPKLPVKEVYVRQSGLDGDEHNHEKHYRSTQAVCIQDIEKLNELSDLGYSLGPGKAGENLTVKNLHVNSLPIGSQLKFSGGVVLEITRVRPTCYVMDQIDTKLKDDANGRHGMYAKVLEDGMLHTFETIDVFLPATTISLQ